MQTIYLVTSGSYSAYSINAAFSTEEKAQEYIDAACDDDDEGWGCRIETYVLDAWQERDTRRYWRVIIYELTRFSDDPTIPTLKEETRAWEITQDWRDPDDKPLPLGVNFGENTLYFYPETGNISNALHDYRSSGPFLTAPQRYAVANVLANDRDHAIKVAADQIAMAKAQQAGIG